MKKLIFVGTLAGFLLPLAALAQSNLDGTWKLDTNQMRDTKPIVILMQNGIYTCDGCFPRMEIKTDGAYHSVSGDPHIDMVALKIVDARHAELNAQKNGKLVTTAQIELSADGNITTETFSDSSNSTTPVTGKEVFERVASAPPGSLPFSGSWRLVKMEGVSDNGITFTMKAEGDSVHMTSPTGQSYTAKLDGTEAPFHGDPGVTVVSLKRIGPNTYEETDKLGDQVISVSRMTVSADGKTMSVEAHDLRTDRTFKYVAVKQ
jgi:hypothetical protein